MGWNFRNVVHGRTNAQGFVAERRLCPACAPTPLVAVLGDGMVEALMVPLPESLTGRLQEMLGPNGRAYAFAQSGAQLAQYVAYARQACAVYRPQKLVVVITANDVDESIATRRPHAGMFQLHPRADGGFDHRLTPPGPASLLETILHNSALALYLVRNVGLPGWTGLPRADTAESRRPSIMSRRPIPRGFAEGERAIAWFLTALPDAACLTPPDIVLAIDALRPAIYDEAALRRRRELCRANAPGGDDAGGRQGLRGGRPRAALPRGLYRRQAALRVCERHPLECRRT